VQRPVLVLGGRAHPAAGCGTLADVRSAAPAADSPQRNGCRPTGLFTPVFHIRNHDYRCKSPKDNELPHSERIHDAPLVFRFWDANYNKTNSHLPKGARARGRGRVSAVTGGKIAEIVATRAANKLGRVYRVE
jgi:hypothetical protein